MSIEKMREEFEAKYPMPFACGWNSRTKEYDCIWEEHAGEDEVEAKILQHNDRLSVWVASRESLVIELPKRADTGLDTGGWPKDSSAERVNKTLAACALAIAAAGVKVKP